MNVKEIITLLENFQNTWNGWNGVIGGLTSFFGGNPVNGAKGFFSEATFAPLSSVFKK